MNRTVVEAVEDLRIAVERLADSVLAQNAGLGLNTRSIDRLLLQVQAATNSLNEATNAQYETRLGIRNINERLAVISKDVDDVGKETREASGVFMTHAPHRKEHAAVGIIEAFGKLPRWSQTLVVFALVLLSIVLPLAVYLWKGASGG